MMVVALTITVDVMLGLIARTSLMRMIAVQ